MSENFVSENFVSENFVQERIRLAAGDHPIAFGTNITFPFLYGNGIRSFASTSLRYAKSLLKPDGAGWGKDATIKATRSLVACVREAVRNGIVIFDCSRAYGGSEQRLAKALRGVPRDQLFIITKIDDQSQFTGRVMQCFEESLRQLQMDDVDLLLLHWPVDFPKAKDARLDGSVPVYARSWKILERIYESGRAKAIGGANFSITQLETLRTYADIMPMANEFECHPLCTRKELNAYCKEHGIQVFAYGALCAMDLRLRNDAMEAVARRCGTSIPQMILKWHIQEGRVPIFGTSRVERVRQYAALDGFELSDGEMDIINSQNRNYRAFPDSEHCDFTKGIWEGWEDYKDCCP